MRDPQEIEIQIPLEYVNSRRNNFIYLYVLPWEEELPKMRDGDAVFSPVHFRDVGIIYLEIQVSQAE